jgi:MFS family permease
LLIHILLFVQGSAPHSTIMSIFATSATADEESQPGSPADELSTPPTEESALLPGDPDNSKPSKSSQWKPPPGFFWIEMAIFSNVFLVGFDGTITASTYAVIGSDFSASNTISWITTSYLITSTAFQPLYGRFSDIFGRRACFFIATLTFLLGCLGCGLAPTILTLNLMRGLTGLGGGGLMTMATVINSDMIPFKRRGMYQAVQNVLFGFGSICGASLGGVIADNVGWRVCFLLQVPIAAFSTTVGYFVIKNPEKLQLELAGQTLRQEMRSTLTQIDISGAVLLVLGLSSQAAALSMGGNNYPWSDKRVITCAAISVVLLVAFVFVELRTKAIPVMPMNMLKGKLAISNLISNIAVGMATYAVSTRLLMLRHCANPSQSFSSKSPSFSKSSEVTLPRKLASAS